MGFSFLPASLEGAAGITSGAWEVYAGGGDVGRFCAGGTVFFSVFGGGTCPFESSLFDGDAPCFKVLRILC